MIESVLPHNLIVLLVASVLLAGIVQGALMVRRAFTNQRLLQERIAELQAVVDDVHERYNKTLGQLAETTRLAREREERDKRRIGELETLIQELRGRIEELERRLPGEDFGERLDRARRGLSRAAQRLAVLGIWPDVAKLPPLNTADEAAAIYNAGFNYRALQDKEATRLNVLRELRRQSYGVIEVGAHGSADGIMLADGMTEPRWWADVLRGHRVRLVVLMACESDLVGDALVRAGMPAVVSVQRKIPDRDAVLFVTALYEGLAASASSASTSSASTSSASTSSAGGGSASSASAGSASAGSASAGSASAGSASAGSASTSSAGGAAGGRAGLAAPVQDAAFGLFGNDLLDLAVWQLAPFGLLHHAACQPLQQAVAFLLVARIGQQGRDQGGAARGQRSLRKPDVQRGDVPVPHVLLVDGVQGSLFEREGNFDETFGVVGHENAPSLDTSIACAILALGNGT